MVTKRANHHGFTLSELLIAVAVLGIIFTITPALFIAVNKFYYLNRAQLEVQQDARILLNLVNRNLRQAVQSSIKVDQATGEPPYSRITFNKSQGTSMTFYQQDNKLIMRSGTVTRTLSSNLRYIAFTFPMSDDLGIISISLTMEHATYQGMTKAMHLAVEKVRVMNE